jgi:hypothetical protein
MDATMALLRRAQKEKAALASREPWWKKADNPQITQISAD